MEANAGSFNATQKEEAVELTISLFFAQNTRVDAAAAAAVLPESGRQFHTRIATKVSLKIKKEVKHCSAFVTHYSR